VVLAIAFAGILAFLVIAITWTARLLRISNLDAQALAEKVAYPDPTSALEWPELRVRSVVPQPDDLSPVILQVGWPAHPERVSNLLLNLDHDEGEEQALSLLCRWSATGAPVAAVRQGTALELRRRQTLERVHAVLLAEDNQAR